jgi:hypothetical protein
MRAKSFVKNFEKTRELSGVKHLDGVFLAAPDPRRVKAIAQCSFLKGEEEGI